MNNLTLLQKHSRDYFSFKHLLFIDDSYIGKGGFGKDFKFEDTTGFFISIKFKD